MNYRTGVSVSSTASIPNRYVSGRQASPNQIPAIQYLLQYGNSYRSRLLTSEPSADVQYSALVENIRGLIKQAVAHGVNIRQIIAALDGLVIQKDSIVEYSRFSTSTISRAVDEALHGVVLEFNPTEVSLGQAKLPVSTGSNRASLPPDLVAVPAVSSSPPLQRQPSLCLSPPASPRLDRKPSSASGGVASTVIRLN